MNSKGRDNYQQSNIQSQKDILYDFSLVYLDQEKNIYVVKSHLKLKYYIQNSIKDQVYSSFISVRIVIKVL